MDDNRLEELLQKAKGESERFFGGWDVDPCRQEVMGRLKREKPNKGFSLVRWGKVAIASACLLVALLVPFTLTKTKQFTPQAITLDKREPAQLVNFVPLASPGQTNHSLLAVLWGVSPEGQYKVVYSSLFNDSAIPHPVYTLDIPGTPYRVALISSEDDQQKYLHYRLIGYTDQSIDTILAEDYVPGGKLDIDEGKMVEEREDGSVTHIVPYQIDEEGTLTLSADKVQLQLGEELLLIGLDLSNQVNFSAQEDILQKINEEKEEDIPKARFSANSVGEECVRLIPNSDPAKSKTLFIRVVR